MSAPVRKNYSLFNREHRFASAGRCSTICKGVEHSGKRNEGTGGGAAAHQAGGVRGLPESAGEEDDPERAAVGGLYARDVPGEGPPAAGRVPGRGSARAVVV